MMKRFISQLLFGNKKILAEIDQIKLMIGRAESARVRALNLKNIQDAEFQVFSQFGEDGIIQYLLSKVEILEQVFVEFGVQDYRESNTRFLALKENWSGLIIDAGREHQRFLKESGMDWRHSVDAVQSFITKENINSLIRAAGISGEIGLLSVDIDGMDYWVWKAIDCIDPRIVVAEYNASFGSQVPVTVPYASSFTRFQAHSSGLYWGSSLAALCHLAEEKKYQFVGCNSAGNNAFFVKKKFAHSLPALSAEQGYVFSRFRESRNSSGQLNYITQLTERRAAISEMVLENISNGQSLKVKDLPREGN